MLAKNDYLKNVAKTIGWKLVNEDKGFSTYEYEIEESKYEHISYVVRILDDPNELEIYEILLSIVNVLPFKLKSKILKLMNKFKMEQFANTMELIIFLVEEYKNKTDYSKLVEYGELLGVDIEELGYKFEYKLKKHKKTEIISQIEYNLPSVLAPKLGRIKKLDYKIAFIKNAKLSETEND